MLIQIESFKSQDRFILVCGVGWRAKLTNEGWIHQTNC